MYVTGQTSSETLGSKFSRIFIYSLIFALSLLFCWFCGFWYRHRQKPPPMLTHICELTNINVISRSDQVGLREFPSEMARRATDLPTYDQTITDAPHDFDKETEEPPPSYEAVVNLRNANGQNIA